MKNKRPSYKPVSDQDATRASTVRWENAKVLSSSSLPKTAAASPADIIATVQPRSVACARSDAAQNAISLPRPRSSSRQPGSFLPQGRGSQALNYTAYYAISRL